MNLLPFRRSDRTRAQKDAFDLVIVLPNLCAGGAQRVATLLAGAWAERGLKLAVITLYSRDDAQTLDPRILRLKLQEDIALCLEDSKELGKGFWVAGLILGPFVALCRLARRIPPLLMIARFAKRAAGKLRLILLYNLARKRLKPGRMIPNSRHIKRVLEIRVLLQRTPSPVILAFLGATNIMTVLAALGLGRRVVISERNDPARQALDPPWERLRRHCYRHADVVTANSRGALETMAAFVPKRKLQLVPNPLILPSAVDPEQRPGMRLVSIGRLVPQKGLDLLLGAFALVAEELPGWHVDLVGDGPARAELEALAERLGIADRVQFHGHQSDPVRFHQTADIFLLTSHFEGMPNALLEAMATGVPAVVVDSSPGPLEYVEHGVSGLVVSGRDPKDFAEAIRTLALDEPFRRRAGQEVKQRVKDLDLATTLRIWDAILTLPAGTPVDARPPERNDAAA
jgi:glycosyltransferase involved in cell wall biosynthesis